MQLIPVIDLLNGTVVHAKKGDRKNYQPIQSLISDSSDPMDVVTALLQYYPFQQLYIADLNAIQKIGDTNFKVIHSIAQRYPALKLWIDAGINNTAELASWSHSNFNVILGSENFSDLDNFLEIKKHLGADFVLSLDFMPDGYCGPSALIENANYWPENVILMSLADVGANQGPNLVLLAKFKTYSEKFNLYSAGGVRNIDDLNLLKTAGIHGTFIASALHSKQISADEIVCLSQ
jgi:phosphoribosylformimino-5-aminoimidazole carboxamide ribotide isomerase